MNINYIETMKQALEALQGLAEDLGRLPEEIQAITNLRAAIDAAEKQGPIYQWRDTRSNTGAWTDSPLHHYKEWKQYPYYEWRVLYTHPAPTQPDSEHAKIGCIGHDGDCCKDREQIYLDAARYRWLRNYEKDLDSIILEAVEYGGKNLDAAIDAAMKVGADKTGEK